MPRASTGRPGHRSGGSRFGLQNWRVRSRLIALILLPTAVAVLVTGIQLTGAINTGTEYRRLTEVAQVIDRLSTLSHEMGLERDLTAWYIADGRRNARYTKVQEQRDRVDMAKAEVMDLLLGLDGGQGQRVKNKVATVRRWLDGLSGLRKLILESRSPARAAVGTYTRMIADFTTLHDELGRDSNDDRLFGDAAALGALTRAKEALSQQIGIMLVTLSTNRFDSDDFADFLAARERQESEVATFKAEATAADAAFYNSTVRGQQVDEADRIRALVLARTRENRAIAQRLTPTAKNPAQAYFDGADATVKKMRVVEKRLATTVVAESTALKEQEQRQAFISGAAILVLLLLVLLVTSRVATSLVRPLRRLRSEALEIAGRRLPDTVQFLRESGDMAPAPEIAPIGVASRDEVGEVARAFDEVHREAIRLAGDEARLRSNVNAMFVNLSRRSQTLVERQLTLIESLEQGEDDETRLGHLFRLDHLATRMRRNSENLLVLAGQEPARRWSQPVPLLDIIRAALSEVENFERVTLQVQQGVSVLGQSVNDVVHLVAELVENAISFSPMETKVTITTSLIDGGLTISVSDLGIGMSADEVSQANWRLANPPVVDVSVSRRMGLFVVGRLALRHGIRVQLRQQDRGGLTAMVLLPDEVLAGHGAPSGGDRAVMADATGPLPMFGLQEPPPGFGTMQPPSRNGHG
ncbi:MAG TPA: nitrate- and nitrite sensing domain-containing protein, partial [Thermopolyspora sp.]